MQSKYFYRLYLTDIKKTFECDTFMPKLPDNIKLIELVFFKLFNDL